MVSLAYRRVGTAARGGEGASTLRYSSNDRSILSRRRRKTPERALLLRHLVHAHPHHAGRPRGERGGAEGAAPLVARDTRVARYWSRRKGDAPHSPHTPWLRCARVCVRVRGYTCSASWLFRAYAMLGAATLKWNKLERNFSRGRREPACARDAQPFPAIGGLRELREGASRVSITALAVLTHLSLSFIAQFDIKRRDIQSPFMNPGRGRFFNRLRRQGQMSRPYLGGWF